MKKLTSLFLLVLVATQLFGWGQTGHRVIGQIAENHMSRQAKKRISAILDGQSLSMVGNFMDEIKSEPKYDSLGPWHYCTIHDGQKYPGAPHEGDVIQAIQKYIEMLKKGGLSRADEAFTLKCLVHLIGDIHQPLHVGKEGDRGGNDVKVTYFGDNTNLHSVWDSGIIEGQKLSYTEYVAWIDKAEESHVNSWKNDGLMVWVDESIALRPQVYNLPENKKIGYRYNYDNISNVNQRLLQGGIRLAAVLEEIYG
ncbi:MAG: S1/P1 nuclease [Cyclobacteriaceae bacterium]|nr:S1/P1 nuclease [Cyclobacteriaceae bacterium]